MWLEPGILISWRWNFLPPRPQEMASFLPLPIADGWKSSSSVTAGTAHNLTAHQFWTSKPYLHCTGLWAILISASTQLPDLNSFLFKALGHFSFAFECGSNLHFLVRSPVSCVWSFAEKDSFHVSSLCQIDWKAFSIPVPCSSHYRISGPEVISQLVGISVKPALQGHVLVTGSSRNLKSNFQARQCYCFCSVIVFVVSVKSDIGSVLL